MPKIYNLQDKTFGKLRVIGLVSKKGEKEKKWMCKCECGNHCIRNTNQLIKNGTYSCGCAKKEKAIEHLKLREGTSLIAIDTKKVRKNNTSGTTGVYKDKRRNTWYAEILTKGKKLYLGSFYKLEDAIKARKKAEEELFEPILEKYGELQ